MNILFFFLFLFVSTARSVVVFEQCVHSSPGCMSTADHCIRYPLNECVSFANTSGLISGYVMDIDGLYVNFSHWPKSASCDGSFQTFLLDPFVCSDEQLNYTSLLHHYYYIVAVDVEYPRWIPAAAALGGMVITCILIFSIRAICRCRRRHRWHSI